MKTSLSYIINSEPAWATRDLISINKLAGDIAQLIQCLPCKQDPGSNPRTGMVMQYPCGFSTGRQTPEFLASQPSLIGESQASDSSCLRATVLRMTSGLHTYHSPVCTCPCEQCAFVHVHLCTHPHPHSRFPYIPSSKCLLQLLFIKQARAELPPYVWPSPEP